MAAKLSSLSVFIAACEAAGLPTPLPEHRFDAKRKWRVDWAFVRGEVKVALEIQGGLFSGGRHVRGAALLREYEKLNALAAHGYRVVFCTPQQFKTGEAIALVERAIKGFSHY